MKTIDQEKKKEIRKRFNLNSLGKFLISLFGERFQILAFLIVIGSLFFLVFLWYNHIFKADWNEAEVQNYILSKQRKSDAIFNRDGFQKIIDESSNRKAEFEAPLNDIQDIFRLRQ